MLEEALAPFKAKMEQFEQKLNGMAAQVEQVSRGIASSAYMAVPVSNEPHSVLALRLSS